MTELRKAGSGINDHIGSYNFTSENFAGTDPVTGNADPAGFTTPDDFTKSDPTPLAVTLNYTEIEWTLIGASVTQPETHGLVPHTIAISHPFNSEREVTMFGSDGLDGLGY